MAKNFNTGPYYDDFDPANNFYRVLFKPGYAVQARELNQLQSILHNQVSTFANHMFKKNAMVIPGGIVLNGSANILQVTDIADPSVLVGKTITNAVNFDLTDDTTLNGYITAVVLAVSMPTETSPAALYLKYFKTQKNVDGTFRSTFGVEDNVSGLRTVDRSIITFKVHSNAATIGKVVTLNKGTFFTKETFVDAASQSLILEVNNQTITNAAVGLDVVESIVTSDDDESLLDNATGSPNQYAPGADRYKIELKLNRYNLGSIPTDERFILMMQFENNVMTYVNNNTQYAELMKTLARRMYETNGNFIVNGLNTTINQSVDDETLWANINAGRCYLGGYEYDQISNREVVIDKPRDAAHQQQLDVVTRYADNLTYFFVPGGTHLQQMPEINSLVQFIDAAPGTVGANVVGHGVFRDIQYVFGDINTGKGIYRMYFDNISFEKGFTLDRLGGIRTIINGEGVPILQALAISNVINGSGPFTIGNDVVSGADATQTGKLYQIINSMMFLIKDTVGDIPYTDTVKDSVTGATATRVNTFITNYDEINIPIYQIDKDTIKTLYNNSDNNVTTFTVTSRDIFTLQMGDNTSPTLGGTDKYADVSPFNYIAVVVDDPYESTYDLSELGVITVDVVNGSKNYTISLTSGDPLIGRTVWVYSTIVKQNATEAKKTKSSLKTITIRNPSDAYTALEDQDIISLVKVTEGKTQTIFLQSTPTDAIKYNSVDGKTTVNTLENHGLTVGDVIVTRSIESSNYTTPYPSLGFNGTFTVTDVPSPTSFKFIQPITSITFDPTTAVDTSTNEITYTAHGFVTGDVVVYDQGAGGTALGGLTHNATYYAINKAANKVQLATSRINAFNFISIDITSVGVGTAHKLTDVVPGTYVAGSGFVALPPSITNDNDVTNRFSLDNGQTHSLIGTGLIKLKKNKSVPIGQLAVQYYYYSVNSGGSYISVDSYGNYTGDLSYIGEIANITSPYNDRITLRSYLDFRTRVSRFFFKNIGTIKTGTNILALKDLNISYHAPSLIGKWIVGPSHPNGATIIACSLNEFTGDTELTLSSASSTNANGVYYVGLTNVGGTDLTLTAQGTAGDRSFSIPRANYPISFQPTKFKSKQTVIYLNRQEDNIELAQMEVASVDEANTLRRDPYKLPLTYVFMEPYCVDMTNVRVIKYENPAYNMLDIHEMNKKIERNEYYTSLALNGDQYGEVMQSEEEMQTTSAQGLWNEDFYDMSTQEFTSSDYACTVYDKSYVSPGVVTRTISLQLDPIGSTGFKQSGACVTLPYTEQTAISQPLSSRFNNLNPYNVVNWNGKMVLTPSVDNWVDTTTVPGPVVVPPTPQPPLPPVIEPPSVPTNPPPVLPEPPIEEIVTEINNLRASWGPDSHGGHHAISFDWKTNTGRTGRVSTDRHKSQIVHHLGRRGYNGEYARSLINKKYTDRGVKEYLHAGNFFDILARKVVRSTKAVVIGLILYPGI